MKTQLNFKGEILGVKCDSSEICNLNQLKKFIKKKYKKIDVLVNNVGDAIKRTKFEKSKDKLWLDSIKLNLMSTVRTTKIFLELLKKVKNSCIVNIGSIAGKNPSSGDSLHYAVTKSALATFTKGLAVELKGVRVNCVAPTLTKTDLAKGILRNERIEENISEKHPLKKICEASDVSGMVNFLVSRDAKMVTGQIMRVDSGMSTLKI